MWSPIRKMWWCDEHTDSRLEATSSVRTFKVSTRSSHDLWISSSNPVVKLRFNSRKWLDNGALFLPEKVENTEEISPSWMFASFLSSRIRTSLRGCQVWGGKGWQCWVLLGFSSCTPHLSQSRCLLDWEKRWYQIILFWRESMKVDIYICVHILKTLPYSIYWPLTWWKTTSATTLSL